MKRVLTEGDGLRVAACHYRAGERHPPHTDALSRISFVIHGGYREEARAGSATLEPGKVLLKSQRAKHEDEFGETTLIALEFIDDDPFGTLTAETWRPRTDAFALRHTATILDAARHGDTRAARTAGVDLVASEECAEVRRGAAPAWIAQLRDELDVTPLADISVAARAHDAGVHPVYASRLFRRHFGISITEHGRAQCVRRAVSSLCQLETPMSHVAVAAGFYDQAHMIRAFRQTIGRTPGAVRASIAACVKNVQ